MSPDEVPLIQRWLAGCMYAVRRRRPHQQLHGVSRLDGWIYVRPRGEARRVARSLEIIAAQH